MPPAKRQQRTKEARAAEQAEAARTAAEPEPEHTDAEPAAVEREGATTDTASQESTREERAAAAEQSRQRVPRFTARQLRTNSAILGEPLGVVIGAFDDADIDADQQLTESEARALVEKFKARPAQTDDQEA